MILRSDSSLAQFSKFAPDLYNEYHDLLDELTEFLDEPPLRRIFHDSNAKPYGRNCAWAACHINFGPETFTHRHIDHKNKANGMCSATAFGNFDPDLGSHLVLWDLELVIRFPPGSTIIFPSALLEHSNLPIQVGEERASLTMFSSAGLFRWVHNGYMTDDSFKRSAFEDEIQAWKDYRKTIWETDVGKFMKWPPSYL